MYFHTDNAYVLKRLASAMVTAEGQGTRVRVDVDSEGRLKYKVGEGIWSEPFDSTPDPYRDNSAEQRPVYGRTLLRDIE